MLENKMLFYCNRIVGVGRWFGVGGDPRFGERLHGTLEVHAGRWRPRHVRWCVSVQRDFDFNWLVAARLGSALYCAAFRPDSHCLHCQPAHAFDPLGETHSPSIPSHPPPTQVASKAHAGGGSAHSHGGGSPTALLFINPKRSSWGRGARVSLG
ncbi:hypothetical protein LSTR_LSTR017405 [Laodelphax striatellus]|uniref:Uncharacterized protein n=1 Tax=Laodelphax striatellus TaxID=195883 RepID=A0A482WG98_LAOST|nr:hypothetical protein LSTR_LSTR017405 [Laodelphax striatellus]